MELLVTGGAQKRLAEFRREHSYGEALLSKVSFDSKKEQHIFRYKTDPAFRPKSGFSNVFKSASLFHDQKFILLTTNTQLISYNLTENKIVNIISHPLFNDIHHAVFKGNYYWVVSTGLDMVIKLNNQGELIGLTDVLGEDPWKFFDKDIDYRKVSSTKPHRSHPNYIFFVDEEPWVTRFSQKDAVALDNPSRRIDISVGNPHDGLVTGDNIFFTTTNGNIIIASKSSFKIVEIINLNSKLRTKVPLGWCRGLHIDIQDFAIYVGFSRLRHTWITQNLLWVSDQFKKESRSQKLPTRIVKISIKDFSIIDEFVFESNTSQSAIFSLLPYIKQMG